MFVSAKYFFVDQQAEDDRVFAVQIT